MSKFFMSLVWLLAAFMLPGASIADPSAETRSYCTTSFTSTSAASVPTKVWTLTTTKKASVVITSTPVQTITPPPVTSTQTSTTVSYTTVSGSSTQVCTEEIIVYETPRVIEPATTTTVFSTVSTTVTQDSGTSTVPTPARFVPIQTSAPQASYQNPPAQARDEEPLGMSQHARRHIRRAAEPEQKASTFGAFAAPSSSYPFEVGCVDLVTSYQTGTSTVTASSTVTRTGSTPTVTSTTVASSTCTRTVGPHSTLTTTITSVLPPRTETPTSTVTQTTSATATFKKPQSTAYAQCAPNNFVNTLRGNYGLVGGNKQGASYVAVSGTFTQVECCELCARTDSCGGSDFIASTGQCGLFHGCGSPIEVVSVAEERQYLNMSSPLGTLSNGCINAVSCARAGEICI